MTLRIVLGVLNCVSIRTVLDIGGRLLSIFDGLENCNVSFVPNEQPKTQVRNRFGSRDSVRPGTESRARTSVARVQSDVITVGFDLVSSIFRCRRKRSRWRDTRRKNIRGAWWPPRWDCTCRWTRARWWTGPCGSGAWPCCRRCYGRATTRKCCPAKTTGRRYCSVSTPEGDRSRADSFRTFSSTLWLGNDLSLLYSPVPSLFRLISSFLVSIQTNTRKSTSRSRLFRFISHFLPRSAYSLGGLKSES